MSQSHRYAERKLQHRLCACWRCLVVMWCTVCAKRKLRPSCWALMGLCAGGDGAVLHNLHQRKAAAIRLALMALCCAVCAKGGL